MASTSVFNVLSKNGNLVAAKYLVDTNGNYVIDPNTVSPLTVPADYNPATVYATYKDALTGVIPYASEYAMLISAFLPGHSQDLPTSYNGQVGGDFVSAFTEQTLVKITRC